MAGKNTKIDYKARLERKLCIARENPEPVFDLSECNLKQIPSNIFTLCRVFRKDALFLQDNLLNSLAQGGSLEELKSLKILNISMNKFVTLPKEINLLHCLEILDVSQNHLTKLPSEIGELFNLKLLNLSHNNLKCLPSTIGNLCNLEEFHVKFNKDLKELPKTFGQLKNLRILEIDDAIYYLPEQINLGGAKSVLNVFQQELNNDLDNPSTSKSSNLPRENTLQNYSQDKKFNILTQEKKQMEINLKNLKLHLESQDARLKLLNDIKNKQEDLDKRLVLLQKQKKVDRTELIKLCQREEKETCDAIIKILGNNHEMRMSLFDVHERERKEEEEKLRNQTLASNLNKPMEKNQILVSMDETMREEIKRFQEMRNEKRLGAIKSLASEIMFEKATLQDLLKRNTDYKKQMLEDLLENEELQKSAVVSLLEKSDAVSWEFARQTSIIEKKLAELTKMELVKKKSETDQQVIELSKNRIELTKVLLDLFDKQAARRKELTDKIRQMESIKEVSKEKDNFWLRQYDVLLNSESNKMVEYLEALNPNLVYQVFVHGVFHYLPLLKDYALSEENLKKLDLNTLAKVGIKRADDRESILLAVKSYLSEEQSRGKTPSAPQSIEPSAPLMSSSFGLSDAKSFGYLVPEDCVICLDSQPNVIFVPCGHVCTCHKCSNAVVLCPICRSEILKKHESFNS